MASWKEIGYVLIIALLFIPLVFLGVRTFIPQYVDYYNDYDSCYKYIPEGDSQAMALQEECLAEQNEKREAYEEEKKKYDVWRYIAVLGVVLLTLLLVGFLGLDAPIKLGLFIGSGITVFIATMQYFETRSVMAFLILVVVFVGILYLVQNRKKYFG